MDKLYFMYFEKLSSLNVADWIIYLTWYIFPFIIIAVMLIFFVIFLVLAERKVLAFYTLRKGPNRVGYNGCLQTIADAIKLLFKEDVTPKNADKLLFTLAPIIAFVPVMVVWGLIPYNSGFIAIESNIGALLYPSIVALPLLGIIIAGYSSNNKYALLGAMRAVALALSYALPMVLCILSVVVLSGTMNLGDIVNSQSSTLGFFKWFFIPSFLGFCIFYISMLAELNRTPFDLSEAESELVAGYNVEYSGMRFALFFLAEYAALFVLSSFMVVLFFGGYLSPLGNYFSSGGVLLYVEQIFWFLLKVFTIILSVMWIRATFPRFRVDTLLKFAWMVLLPLAILNFLLVSLIKFWGIA